MSGIKLSRRLKALAEWVPEGARFADIGTDHALLPVYLTHSGKVNYAIAGDVNEGPVDAAKRQVLDWGLEEKVSVRHGDGLSVLAPGEVDTVCIAGMGGSLMVRLLTDAGDILASVTTLILSPHVAEDGLRRWLKINSYVLDREELLEEDGVIYTLLRASRGVNAEEAVSMNAALYDVRRFVPCLSDISLSLVEEMGPMLLRQPNELFMLKWEQEITKREKIVERMRQSSSEDAALKAEEWKREIARIGEVLSCLREARK